jgi:serine protease
MTACGGNVAEPTSALGSAQMTSLGSAHAQYLPTRFAAQRTTSAGIPYNGGIVLVHPKFFVVFWGYKKYGDPDKVAPLLTRYLKSMGGSGHNNIYTQYYQQLSSQSQKTYITNPKMQLGGVWYDETNKVPESPTDAQVAAEALAAHNHFGATSEAAFVVATPHGRSTVGFGTKFCAYHSAYNFSGDIYYTNLPYIPDARDNCGANFISPPKDENGADEGVTIAAGAMEGDSVTDPVPGTGWSGSEGGEISSPCVWNHVENDSFGKEAYTVGPMFSDVQLECVQTYSVTVRRSI